MAHTVPVREAGAHAEEGEPALRGGCAVNKVQLASCAADLPDADALSAYLAVQIRRKTAVDGEHIVILSPTASAIELTDAGDYIFRIYPSDIYDGAFLEDGTDDEVKNVLALLFKNTSDKDIQYAEYAFAVDGKPISFKVSDLPAGQQCVVLEASRHQRNTSEVLELISRVVAQVDMLPGSDKVLPVINDDNTITLMNTTQEELPVVRVFYKYFYEDENSFVGGITYTATATKVPAGGSVTIAPSHFEANASVIMGTGVYDQ